MPRPGFGSLYPCRRGLGRGRDTGLEPADAFMPKSAPTIAKIGITPLADGDVHFAVVGEAGQRQVEAGGDHPDDGVALAIQYDSLPRMSGEDASFRFQKPLLMSTTWSAPN